MATQPARSEVYADYFQHADTAMNVTLVVRGPASLQPKIERIVTSLNRSTAVNFESMDGVISGTITRERFQTALLGLFAALCTATGCRWSIWLAFLYSGATNQRNGCTRGARRKQGDHCAIGVTGAGVLVLVGVTLGLIGSMLATRTLQAMLYEVRTNDPSALLAVIAGFAAAALAGCYLPARRASRIDPSEALRTE